MMVSNPYVKRTMLPRSAFCHMLWSFCYGVDCHITPAEAARFDTKRLLYLNLNGFVLPHRRNAAVCARALGLNRSTVTRYFTRFRKRMASHVTVRHADHELVTRFHDPNTRYRLLADLAPFLHTPTICRARTYDLHLLELVFRRVHLQGNIYTHLLAGFKKDPL